MAENCGGRYGSRTHDLLGVNDPDPRQTALFGATADAVSPLCADYVPVPCKGLVQTVPEDPCADLRDAAAALDFGPLPPSKPRRIKAHKGHMVYFVGGDDGPVKIGWTQQPIKERLKCLQSGSPVKLHVLALQPAPRSKELLYHRQFAASRIHGEWFERSPEIVSLIEALRGERGVGHS